MGSPPGPCKKNGCVWYTSLVTRKTDYRKQRFRAYKRTSRVLGPLKLLHAYVEEVPQTALKRHDHQSWGVAVVQS